MKRKPRSYEKTCNCRAYPFPHRLLGGRCDGKSIVLQAYNVEGSGDCAHCQSHSLANQECEVLDGREKPKYAECVRNFVRFEGVRPPKSWQIVHRNF